MSTPQSGDEIEPATAADLESFAGELEPWGASLPPPQRAILMLLLTQTLDEGDVEGFASSFAASFSQATIVNLSPAFTQGIGFRAAPNATEWERACGWLKSGAQLGGLAGRR